jgi:hypothetical protein
MKALVCGSCGDIQALQEEWRICKCGNVAARWTDPQAGRAEVHAEDRSRAFILGLNNRLLIPALRGELGMFQDFRKHHDLATVAPGYVFDKSMADCWAVLIRVGASNDVVFTDEGPPPKPKPEMPFIH